MSALIETEKELSNRRMILADVLNIYSTAAKTFRATFSATCMDSRRRRTSKPMRMPSVFARLTIESMSGKAITVSAPPLEWQRKTIWVGIFCLWCVRSHIFPTTTGPRERAISA